MVRILLVSGSLRAGSGNSALLRTAAAIAPAGVEAEVYGVTVESGRGERERISAD